MRRIINYEIESKEQAQELFIKAIQEYKTGNKRQYIEKNISANNKYPSVTYFRENFELSFDECRELTDIPKVNIQKIWDKEKLEKILYSLFETHGFKIVTWVLIKEETGIDLQHTIVRYFKKGIKEIKEEFRNKYPHLAHTSYD